MEIKTITLRKEKIRSEMIIDKNLFLKNLYLQRYETLCKKDFYDELRLSLEAEIFKTNNYSSVFVGKCWFDSLLIEHSWLRVFFGKPKLKEIKINWEEIYNTVYFPDKNPLVKVYKVENPL